jgi:cyclophilin family peptidyl-prolyl cis-trans isomerase/HEAT repeat protein
MPLQLLLAAVLAAAPARAEPTLRERARAQDYSSFPILRDALQGPDASVRPEAAFALGQLGLVELPAGEPEPPEAARTRAAAEQALGPAASDPDPELRRSAVEALGKVGGPDSEPFLLAAATDAEAAVRGEAALALFRMRFLKRVPEYSTAAFSRLATLAGDPEPEVRWRALYAFSRFPEPRAAPVAAAAARDADARVRLFAARALAQLKAAPAPALLADPDVYVRAAAVGALAAAAAWDRIPDAVFSDSSPHVRAAAADAAAASDRAERFDPLLRRELADPGTLVPARAEIALARLEGDDFALDLERLRRDPRWPVRAAAYEAAAFLPESEGVLRAGVADADPRVAAQALETLAASTAPIADLLNRILFDKKAPLELAGTAASAAADRGSRELADAVLAAADRAEEPELREDLRRALLAIAEKNPDRAEGLRKKAAKYRPFTDKPKRFKPPKVAPSAVVFETDRGTFTVELAGADDAGNHVAAFVDSVKRGLYDGLTWHRVVTGFVVQGGDPRGSGWGDAGWRLADEINRLPFVRGTVGMPKAGKDTGGCQLFVTTVPAPYLDGRYTAFGRVASGLEVLDLLEPGDKILHARLQ